MCPTTGLNSLLINRMRLQLNIVGRALGWPFQWHMTNLAKGFASLIRYYNEHREPMTHKSNVSVLIITQVYQLGTERIYKKTNVCTRCFSQIHKET